MPRKNKSAASVAENREAQRRSRARRQELIENLQCRLEQYERMGIAASVEMQRVARAVNTQNQLLKNLLGTCGVSQEEIERFLSSPEGDYRALNDRQRCNTCGRLLLGAAQTTVISTDDPPQSSPRSTLSMTANAVPIPASLVSDPPLSTPVRKQLAPTEPPIESIRTREENDRVFLPQGEERRLHQQIHTANRLDNITVDCSSALKDRLSPLSDSFDSSKSISPYSNHPGALETSCDKAAEILVELHNHVDPSSARSALGCHGNGYCHVKNTKIFQLMDHLD